MVSGTHWVVQDNAPLRVEPGRGIALASLPMYTRVQVLREVSGLYEGAITRFYFVEYLDAQRKPVQGFVYAGYLEPYQNALHRDVVPIVNGTLNPNDAEQYLVWQGKTQFNLCGYFCVAFCTGWTADIVTMLDLVRNKKPILMARLFNTKNNGLTGLGDLEALLSALGYEAPALHVSALLHDPVLRRVMLTPARLANILSAYHVIYGVRINKRSGRLARSGILHWVVLKDVIPNEYGGAVELYNPFGNKIEVYEWEQLVESGGAPYGLAVPK